MKHTGIPWRTSEIVGARREKYPPLCRVVDRDGLTICVVYGRDPENTEQLARDAELIAAAPRLLNAVMLAYRKHHLGDESIGWEELASELRMTLDEALGVPAVLEWCDQIVEAME